MRTDEVIKKDVTDELNWVPNIDAARIGVAVANGIVTLSGSVSTFAEKIAAEKAAKKVNGVKAIVQEIDVKIGSSYKRTDEDIAKAALNNIKWNTSVPDDKIKLKVENGWITLEGSVEWNFQKEAARNAIKNLRGVRGVTNLITIKSDVEPQNIKEKIRKSLERNASIDADNVVVRIDGHKVYLSGTVRSWVAKQQAENAAWFAPGVSSVENNIEIKITEHAY